MCVKRDETHREIYNLKKNTDVIVDRACVAINACSWSHVGVDWLCASNIKRKKTEISQETFTLLQFLFYQYTKLFHLNKVQWKQKNNRTKKKTANTWWRTWNKGIEHPDPQDCLRFLYISTFILLCSDAEVLGYLFGGLMLSIVYLNVSKYCLPHK